MSDELEGPQEPKGKPSRAERERRKLGIEGMLDRAQPSAEAVRKARQSSLLATFREAFRAGFHKAKGGQP